MKTYRYFYPALNCHVLASYLGGFLQKIELEDFELREETPPTAKVVVSEKAFINSCKSHNVPYTETLVTITFDMFYDAYGNKVGKPEALAAWNKLTLEEQIAAYYFIPRYKARVKLDRVSMLYPASYLNKKRFLQ